MSQARPSVGAAESLPPDTMSLRHIPFMAHLGVEVLHIEPGLARLSLDPKPEHCNSWGAIHGGVVMALLDVSMGMAGRGYDPEHLLGVTVEMSTSFIAPGRGRQLAIGRVVARSTTLWRCEAEIRSAADDTLVARAIGTFMFKNLAQNRKKPAGDA